jgi:hypothetical protein
MTSGMLIWGFLLLFSIVGFIIAISYFGTDKNKSNRPNTSDKT